MQSEYKRTKGSFERIIDEHIGNKIRTARPIRIISQIKLAEILGLTFQQIQKYEKSQNRRSASRLWSIASALDFPISFFFDDLPNSVSTKNHSQNLNYPFERKDVVELVFHYMKLYRNFPVTTEKFLDLLKQTAYYSKEIQENKE